MAKAKTRAAIQKILNEIEYLDWEFFLSKKGDGFLLQAAFDAPDASDPEGKSVQQKSRKWYISAYSCEREIVDACYGLIQRAIIHEMNEFFKYKRQAIFNGHILPGALVAMAHLTGGREDE